MSELLTAILGFPTVIYTVMLAVVLLYWLFVILGALDIDLFHHAGGDGALEGAGAEGLTAGLDGAHGAHGAVDAAAGHHGALEGGAEHAHAGAEGGAEHAGHADAGSTGLLGALRLRDAPITVVTSFVTLYGWLLSFFGMRHLAPVVPVPGWVSGLGVMLASFVLALLMTSVTVRPIGRYFKTHSGKRRQDFVGSVCEVQTGEVTDTFGQALIDDGQAGLVVQVRATSGKLATRRGDHVLILEYDDAREAYIVEPYEDVVPGARRSQGVRAADEPPAAPGADDAALGAAAEDEAGSRTGSRHAD
ncbi:MAG: glycine zipper family protein [Polyangiaceae bacterium]|nr:glycine zipper family protein [Polyangiaceae bacterium]